MTTTLSIDGMSCSHCVRSVKQALESVPGIGTADVNLESNSAVVTHDGALSLSDLKAALEEEGFTIKDDSSRH